MAKQNAIDGILEPFKKGYDIITDLLFKAISYPFKWWQALPDWVHSACLITLFLISCLILWYIIRTKNEFWELEA